jgi:hypothetical protein
VYVFKMVTDANFSSLLHPARSRRKSNRTQTSLGIIRSRRRVRRGWLVAVVVVGQLRRKLR